MKLKHSKYRNTGILFELLVRQITADSLKGIESPAIGMVKKYFVNTQMGREYKLYEAIMSSKVVTESVANAMISTVLEKSSKVNRKILRNEKYNLIKEIKNSYDLNTFFKIKVDGYKRLASIYTLIESYNTKEDVETSQIINNKVTLLEFLTKSEVKESEVESQVLKEFKNQDTEIRLMAYKILLERFNDKYDNLNQFQKDLLQDYIVSENSTVKLRTLYNKNINIVKDQLTEELSNVTDKVVKIKLEEVLKYVKELSKTDKINSDNLVDLMEYHELTSELAIANA